MRTAILGLTLLLWLPCFATDASAQIQGVLQDTLKLRKTPSLKGVQIGTLKAGAKVTIVDAKPTNGFYHVRVSRNREGWIWAKGVKLSGAGSSSRALVRHPQAREFEPHPGAIVFPSAWKESNLKRRPRSSTG